MPLNQEEFERKFREEQDFIPRPAVERRSATANVPEIMFQGANYVIGPPMVVHEQAEAYAAEFAATMRGAMVQAGLSFVGKCPKAKA